MADPQDPRAWRHTMAPRLAVLASVFGVCVLTVVGRLVILQAFQYDHYKAQSDDQQHDVLKVTAPRGEILDRHGKVLATSVEVDTICADPSEIKDPRAVAEKLCAALGDCSAESRAELLANLNRSSRKSVYVRRWARPEQVRRVMDLDLAGVFLKAEPRRYYPGCELASQVLGFVGKDNVGLYGIERRYDTKLRGTDGRLLFEMDGRKNRKPFSRIGTPPRPGQTIELTIDANLQHIAERELRAGVEENRALGGSVVMLDPRTGEILASASYPFLNANRYGDGPRESQRNRAVQDIYEPGSTFKIVTASAALQEHLMRPTDLVDTGDGTIRIGNRVVDEYKQHRYGVLSFTDVLVKSSNVGAIRIGLRVGAETLARYVSLFGFGTRLSPDFVPAENAGLVWKASDFNDGAVASVSMGYQVSVTPLQMAAAASVVANGGELVQPRVVRAVIDAGERQVVPRKVLRRVISPETASELTSIMEAVVERGTATKAALVDFTVAGKTGTSNKNRDGHYVEEYNTSFVGFVPSRNPALTILVHIDTPRGPNPAAGGAVAAPIFHRIADASLRYLGVPSTINPLQPVLMARHDGPDTVPVSGPSVPLTIVPASTPLSPGQILLPDLRGLSGREAVRVLSRLGIRPRMAGDGVVIDQEPMPGTPVDIGGTCRLRLGRAIPELHP